MYLCKCIDNCISVKDIFTELRTSLLKRSSWNYYIFSIFSRQLYTQNITVIYKIDVNGLPSAIFSYHQLQNRDKNVNENLKILPDAALPWQQSHDTSHDTHKIP